MDTVTVSMRTKYGYEIRNGIYYIVYKNILEYALHICLQSLKGQNKHAIMITRVRSILARQLYARCHQFLTLQAYMESIF